jgi:hypothetical protein
VELGITGKIIQGKDEQPNMEKKDANITGVYRKLTLCWRFDRDSVLQNYPYDILVCKKRP